MKHIIITKNIRDLAIEFRKELSTGRGTYVPPKTKLADLKNKLTKTKHQQYVQLIIDLWDDLIIATPADIPAIEKKFSGIIKTKAIAKVKSRKGELLYSQIVNAMRYDYVQSTIYPNYIVRLGIKTCVYCNAQYAFAVPGTDRYLNYELDHYLPKSKYPYLCTTFMNLQPCCSKCNKKKSANEPDPKKEEIFRLFMPEGTPDVPKLFRLSDASMAKYMATAKSKDLEIIFDYPGNPKMRNGYENFFQISTLYKAHKDVAEELLWKKYVYNHIIREIYSDQFKALKFKDKDFNRFILGNYDRTEDIHKRPLSKMTQDIAKDLDLI
jgi:5-methylcytosine-specific restriction endonuclease McrA